MFINNKFKNYIFNNTFKNDINKIIIYLIINFKTAELNFSRETETFSCSVTNAIFFRL